MQRVPPTGFIVFLLHKEAATMNEEKELSTYLELLAHLKEKDLAKQGLMALEGRIVIEKALEAGIVPRILVCTEAEKDYWHARTKEENSMVGAHTPRSRELDFPIYTTSHEALCSLVDFKFHRGAIAMADVPELELFDMEHNSQLHQFHRAHCTHAVWSPTIAGVRAPLGRQRPFYLCLWNVTDPSNLGALIRTAAGFGVDGVLIGPGCANPFYRKAIRASMGNVFVLPLWSVDVHGLEKLKQNGAVLVAAALDENSMALEELVKELEKLESSFGASEDEYIKDESSVVGCAQNSPIILLLGNEGYGLPAEVLGLSSIHVRIPMERGVDSLNVAVAGGILMYEIIRAPQSLC